MTRVFCVCSGQVEMLQTTSAGDILVSGREGCEWQAAGKLRNCRDNRIPLENIRKKPDFRFYFQAMKGKILFCFQSGSGLGLAMMPVVDHPVHFVTRKN